MRMWQEKSLWVLCCASIAAGKCWAWNLLQAMIATVLMTLGDVQTGLHLNPAKPECLGSIPAWGEERKRGSWEPRCLRGLLAKCAGGGRLEHAGPLHWRHLVPGQGLVYVCSSLYLTHQRGLPHADHHPLPPVLPGGVGEPQPPRGGWMGPGHGRRPY